MVYEIRTQAAYDLLKGFDFASARNRSHPSMNEKGVSGLRTNGWLEVISSDGVRRKAARLTLAGQAALAVWEAKQGISVQPQQ